MMSRITHIFVVAHYFTLIATYVQMTSWNAICLGV